MIVDGMTGEPIQDAIVHVTNITSGRKANIRHDITSGKTVFIFKPFLFHLNEYNKNYLFTFLLSLKLSGNSFVLKSKTYGNRR